jgi:hypothetical protein
MDMETNWAAEHLQVIRTLMERSALYRRALAPVMILCGVLGLGGGVLGWTLQIGSVAGFIGCWAGVALLALGGSFLLVRRQALKAEEAFWSPPTRRIAQTMLPPLTIGALAGLSAVVFPHWNFLPSWGLPVFWMLLYGCALQAAGFFVQRGIKLLGWMFVLGGCALMGLQGSAGTPPSLADGHKVMGAAFGGLHLAYGIYLYFTEKGRNEA